MASSMTLPTLHLKSHFLRRKILPTKTQKPIFSVPKHRSISYPKATAKFNLFEVLGGRGLCNGEKGIELELKNTIAKQNPDSPPPSASTDSEQVSGSRESIAEIPADGFDKEMMGLTGGFPGGEAGLRKFIEENPPENGGGSESAVLRDGMVVMVKNRSNPFYNYCGIVQRIGDGRVGVRFEGGNWDRLVTFRLEELEPR